MFPPFLSATVYQPKRRWAWRLHCEPYDYRCAANPWPLGPRGGEWYSRSFATMAGDIALICPAVADTDRPNPINAWVRLSWWPARVTIKWREGGNSYQKLSARPHEGACEWLEAEYGDAVFDTETRQRYPRAFIEDVHPPFPPRPDVADQSKTSLLSQEEVDMKEEEEESGHSCAAHESWNYDNDRYGAW